MTEQHLKIEKGLEELLELSKTLSQKSFEVADEDVVLELNNYLSALEEWQVDYKVQLREQEGDSESYRGPNREKIKQLLKELESNHAIILSQSSGLMTEVKAEIGRVNKSSNVIKSYISNSMPVSKPTGKKG